MSSNSGDSGVAPALWQSSRIRSSSRSNMGRGWGEGRHRLSQIGPAYDTVLTVSDRDGRWALTWHNGQPPSLPNLDSSSWKETASAYHPCQAKASTVNPVEH